MINVIACLFNYSSHYYKHCLPYLKLYILKCSISLFMLDYISVISERPSEPSGMTAGIPVDHGQSLTPDRRPNNAESATPDSTTKQPIYPPSYLMLSVVTSIFAFFLTLMLMWCCTIPAVVFGANVC